LTGKDTRRINVLGALASPALLAVNRGLGFPDERGFYSKLLNLYRNSRNPCLAVLKRRVVRCLWPFARRPSPFALRPSPFASRLSPFAFLPERRSPRPFLIFSVAPSAELFCLPRRSGNCLGLASGALASRFPLCAWLRLPFLLPILELCTDRVVSAWHTAYPLHCLLSGPTPAR